MCVRQRARSGVLAALLCAVVGIAGCGRPPPVGEPGEITGFVGGAAADAPRAALVARGVLSGGGTAVDAAVAAYFALAVTYPVAAGLGGGGVCAVYDAPSQTADTIEFLPRSPAAGGPVSVPGAVRGIAALHARYGRLDWGFLLEPAERFASEGHSVSRALARALAKTTPQILANRELRAIFGRDEGVVEEGQMLVQIELAAVIRQIKLRGSGSFYQGQAAGLLIEGIEAAGGRVTAEDLRTYQPVWREAEALRFGDLDVYTVPAPPVGGVLTGQMWAMLADAGRYTETTVEARAHLLAEVSARAFADRALEPAANRLSAFRAHSLVSSYRPEVHTVLEVAEPVPWGSHPNGAASYTTSFVTADRGGSVVACGLTMNGPFGMGGIAPITGIALAPAATSDSSAYLGPVLVGDRQVGGIVYAAAASGGASAPAAMMRTALGALFDRAPLDQAVAAARVFHPGVPDQLYYEPSLDRAALGALWERGHVYRPVSELGLVNAMRCLGGIVRRPKSCAFQADPRGFGLALGGES